MSSSKIRKNSTNARRKNLAAKIESWGFVMAPCSRCTEKNLLCFVHGHHPRCSECESANAACDGTMSEAEWERLQEKKAGLKKKLQAAKEKIAVASKALADGATELAKLADALEGIENRENNMIAREGANLLFFDPPGGNDAPSSPTLSQLLGELREA